MESASVDRLLACFRTLLPSLHSFSYICVLLLQVDYEVTAKQEDFVIRLYTMWLLFFWVCEHASLRSERIPSRLLNKWDFRDTWMDSKLAASWSQHKEQWGWATGWQALDSAAEQGTEGCGFFAYLVLQRSQTPSMHWRLWNNPIWWRDPYETTQYDLSCSNKISSSRQVDNKKRTKKKIRLS